MTLESPKTGDSSFLPTFFTTIPPILQKTSHQKCPRNTQGGTNCFLKHQSTASYLRNSRSTILRRTATASQIAR